LLQRLRHPLGYGASSKSSRLEHEHALARHPRLIEQSKRHDGALACSWRRLKDNREIRSERARQLWKCFIDR
jgi:hypothetical protein